MKKIAQGDLGLERWREQGPRAVAARKKVVSAFLKKIQTPKKKPRRSAAAKPKAPKKASKKRSIYQPGDCLSVRLSDGTVRGGVDPPFPGEAGQGPTTSSVS